MTWRVAGIDEAGRGPLAGPVVAAAVILRPGRPIRGVADSKLLSAARRAELNVAIRRRALCFGIGWADAREIDSLNILQATFLAMRRAVLSMACRPDELLVDGNRLPVLRGLGGEVRARAIVGGDATEAAIGAASILAKTARDSYMNEMHAIYPEYAFARHKGYPTQLHRRLLALHGPCPLHRRSFAPLAGAPPGACQARDEEQVGSRLRSDESDDELHTGELGIGELEIGEPDSGTLDTGERDVGGLESGLSLDTTPRAVTR